MRRQRRRRAALPPPPPPPHEEPPALALLRPRKRARPSAAADLPHGSGSVADCIARAALTVVAGADLAQTEAAARAALGPALRRAAAEGLKPPSGKKGARLGRLDHLVTSFPEEAAMFLRWLRLKLKAKSADDKAETEDAAACGVAAGAAKPGEHPVVRRIAARCAVEAPPPVHHGGPLCASTLGRRSRRCTKLVLP